MTFEDYSVRYFEDLPLVLKNISLSISAGKKVSSAMKFLPFSHALTKTVFFCNFPNRLV